MATKGDRTTGLITRDIRSTELSKQRAEKHDANRSKDNYVAPTNQSVLDKLGNRGLRVGTGVRLTFHRVDTGTEVPVDAFITGVEAQRVRLSFPITSLGRDNFGEVRAPTIINFAALFDVYNATPNGETMSLKKYRDIVKKRKKF